MNVQVEQKSESIDSDCFCWKARFNRTAQHYGLLTNRSERIFSWSTRRIY